MKIRKSLTATIPFLPPYIFSIGWFSGMDWALFRLEILAQDDDVNDFFTIFNLQILKFFISIDGQGWGDLN